MNPDELARRLLATFLDELDEQVHAMNAELLALEQDPADSEHLRALFRVAHNVKGAARVADVPMVEEAFHSLESLFAAVRDAGRLLVPDDFALLFASADAIADAGQRIRREQPLGDSPLVAILPRIRDAVAAPVSAPTATPSAPRLAPAAPAERIIRPHPARSAQPALEPATRSTDAIETTAELVRVAPARLDELMAYAGELLVASSRVQERLTELHAVRDTIRELRSNSVGTNGGTVPILQQDMERVSQSFAADTRTLSRITNQLGSMVRDLRMRPFADACQALPRAVRDVAAVAQKEVRLELLGQDVDSDRAVVDALREPLLHLVRNAIDHGIEPPEERVAAGKSRDGTIRVGATLHGGKLVVTVSDDGAGVDTESLRRAYARQGRVAPESERDLGLTLLAGGISTREKATAISGRGVGLDAVRATMERIGGSVDLQWERGKGTTFILECPPTTATIRALLFLVGGQAFALPSSNVERLVRVRRADLRYAEGRALFANGETPVPVTLLSQILGIPGTAEFAELSYAVLSRAGSRRALLVVDAFLAEQEVVIRPVQRAGASLPHIIGGAVLPSGKLALVLSPSSLLASALSVNVAQPMRAEATEQRKRRILIADDSITTRTLEQSVLEAAGYDVSTASDGQDAWRKLHERGADLLISDVEMPRMDGITLCENVRRSKDFRELRVILMTGLESDEHRMRGLEAGADAYLGKSTFDQATLLDTIRQLLG
jgi:two-component system chemotaxis sensor kinase CheA